MKNTLQWMEFCINQHDVVCNQKYDRTLPYSVHLTMVNSQANRFANLLDADWDKVFCACYGHDLIEDARLSYNDIKQNIGEEVAEIIFLCTENKGRNRKDRKNESFYLELRENKLAVFVKLCDIMANSLYSTISNSSMLKKQKKEWPLIKYYLLQDSTKEYQPLFDSLDKIYEL